MSNRRTGDTSVEDEYPSIRRVLSDQDKVANVYCALKWVIWQSAWLVLGIFGLVIGAIFGIVIGTGILIVEVYHVIVPDRIKGLLGPRVERAKESVSSGTKSAVKTAQEKPVTRRVYNTCPVTFKKNPRYQERIADWIDEKL